jgi:hypothetical protein
MGTPRRNEVSVPESPASFVLVETRPKNVTRKSPNKNARLHPSPGFSVR